MIDPILVQRDAAIRQLIAVVGATREEADAALHASAESLPRAMVALQLQRATAPGSRIAAWARFMGPSIDEAGGG